MRLKHSIFIKTILAGLLIATLALRVQAIAAAPIPQSTFTTNKDVVAIQPPAFTNASLEMFPAGTTQLTNLDQVLQVYAGLAGKTILRSATWKGQAVTLKCDKPLTGPEALEALEGVLALSGTSLIDFGNGFMKAFEADPGRQVDGGDPYVTQILRVTWCKPSDLAPALSPLASMPGRIYPMDRERLLVLRDRPENLKRMLAMLDMLDQPAPPEFISEVIPINYARASEVADALNSLIAGVSAPVKASDGSTNRLEEIIRQVARSGALENTGTLKIVVDDRSNSILIFATKEEMPKLKNTVLKLDVPPRQILIDAVVVEVPLPDSRSTGNRHPGSQPLAASDYLFENHVHWLTNLVRVTMTNDAAVVQDGFSYVAGLGDGFNAMVATLGSERRANVIQRPRILTSDGTPGLLFGGPTRWHQAPPGYDPNAGGQHSWRLLPGVFRLQITPRFQSDGSIAIGILAEAGKIIGATYVLGGVDHLPVTATTSSTASVAMRDGELIMIGGAISPPPQRSSGIPVLKHIPVLGSLFRSPSARLPRTELVVLLKPTVLPAASGGQESQVKLIPREGSAPSTFPF